MILRHRTLPRGPRGPYHVEIQSQLRNCRSLAHAEARRTDPPAADAVSPAAATDAARQRHIRSFVVRAGRMTQAQERAWRELWPRLGLDRGPVFRLRARCSVARLRVVFEVGFGNGESLVALATAHPERNFVGLEVHPPGVGHLLLQCEAAQLANVRIVCDDAVEVLQRRVADATLDELLLLFPGSLAEEAAPQAAHRAAGIRGAGGAQAEVRRRPAHGHRLAALCRAHAGDRGAMRRAGQRAADGQYVERPASRPLTRFERRGQRLGHGVWDLALSGATDRPGAVARPAPRAGRRSRTARRALRAARRAAGQAPRRRSRRRCASPAP